MKFSSSVVFAFTLLCAVQSYAATYRVVRSYPLGKPKAGLENLLRFSLYRGASTTALTSSDLQIEHEKLIHLMALDSGFSGYHHEHPAEVSPGVWEVSMKINVAGKYRIWMQFLPEGEVSTKLLSFDDSFLNFEGEVVPNAPLESKVKLESTEGEYKVTLSLPDGDLFQHTNAPLKFSFSKNGKVIPVTDLDNYLGAKMHLAGISGDKKDFMHAHPGHHIFFDEGSLERADLDIIHGHFMQTGYYGLFLQFSHEKALHTVRLGVTVKGMKEDLN